MKNSPGILPAVAVADGLVGMGIGYIQDWLRPKVTPKMNVHPIRNVVGHHAMAASAGKTPNKALHILELPDEGFGFTICDGSMAPYVDNCKVCLFIGRQNFVSGNQSPCWIDLVIEEVFLPTQNIQNTYHCHEEESN